MGVGGDSERMNRERERKRKREKRKEEVGFRRKNKKKVPKSHEYLQAKSLGLGFTTETPISMDIKGWKPGKGEPSH